MSAASTDETETLPAKTIDLVKATSGHKAMAMNSTYRAMAVNSLASDIQGTQEKETQRDLSPVSSSPTERPDADSPTNESREAPISDSEDEIRNNRMRRRQEPEFNERPMRPRQHYESHDDYDERYLLPPEPRPSQNRGPRHSHVPVDAPSRTRYGRDSQQEVHRHKSREDVRYDPGPPSRPKYKSGRDEPPPNRGYASSTRSRDMPSSRRDAAVIYVSRSGRRIYESRSDSEEYDGYSGTETASDFDDNYRVQEPTSRNRSRRREYSDYDRQMVRVPEVPARSHGGRREVKYIQDEIIPRDGQNGRFRAVDVEGTTRLAVKNSRSRMRSRPVSPDIDEETVQGHGDRTYSRVSESSWAPSGQMPAKSGSAHLPDLDEASVLSSDTNAEKAGVINTSNPISRIQYDMDFTMRKLLNEQVFEEFIKDPLGRHRFRDYLEATGDTYALDFWTDTEHCNRLLSELRASSLAVTGIYLSQDSRERSDVVAQEVIDGAAVVVQKIGSIDISFENAQGQLLRSMYHNQFQGYVKHKLIQETAVQLGKHNLSEMEQEGLGDCFCLTNPRMPDHPIVLVSEGFCGVTGYPRNQIVGRNCRFLQGPGTAPESVDRIRHGLNTEEGCTELLLNYRRNGEPFYCLLCIIPLRDTSGNIAYFIGGQTNVTGIMTGKKSLGFLIGGNASSTNLSGQSGNATGTSMSPAMALYTNNARNDSSIKLSSGSASIMEPRKAAGLAAVLSHGSTMNTQKTTLLSSIFKRGDKGDLGVAPRQALAGAESTMNGPAKTIQDQLSIFKDTYSKVMIFKRAKREITFVTQALLMYFGLPCLSQKDLYSSELIERDIISVLYDGDKIETKRLHETIKNGVKRGDSFSVRCGLRVLGKQKFFSRNEYLQYKPGGAMHLTPLLDLDGTAVAYCAIFG